MDSKEIKSLVKLMRSQGISSLKTQEIELILSEVAPIKRKRKPKGAAIDEPLPKNKGFKGYTDEQLLSWSSLPPGEDLIAEDPA